MRCAALNNFNNFYYESHLVKIFLIMLTDTRLACE